MEIFNHIILKTERLHLDHTLENKEMDLHVAFGIDRNFARGMGVCMTSMIINNPDKNIEFHIFTDSMEKTDLEKVKELRKYPNIKMNLYYIDSNAFKTLPTTMAWSQAIYYRFIMAKVLQGSVGKILYVDADILCVGALDELLQTDMADNIIIGIEDNFVDVQDRIEHLSIKNGKYFNSGVLYIDINRWNEEEISEKAVDLLVKNPGLYQSFDQDVLNVLLDGKTYFMNEKWNYIYNLGYMTHEIPGDRKLIHFTGDKPWQRWTEHHGMVKIYHDYMVQSPWRSDPLSEPSHYKEKRRMAKSYEKRGNYIKALFWFGKYLVARRQSK